MTNLKVTYKEIASFIDKDEQTIKYYKATNQNLLNILKTGSLLKKHGLDTIQELKEILNLKETINKSDLTAEQLSNYIKALNSINK